MPIRKLPPKKRKPRTVHTDRGEIHYQVDRALAVAPAFAEDARDAMKTARKKVRKVVKRFRGRK